MDATAQRSEERRVEPKSDNYKKKRQSLLSYFGGKWYINNLKGQKFSFEESNINQLTKKLYMISRLRLLKKMIIGMTGSSK